MPQTLSVSQIIQRYPCLVGHIICESRSYFSVFSAALALRAHIQAEEHACEWYIDSVTLTGQTLLEVNRTLIAGAFANRRFHGGPFGYRLVKRVIDQMRQGKA